MRHFFLKFEKWTCEYFKEKTAAKNADILILFSTKLQNLAFANNLSPKSRFLQKYDL